LGLLLGFHLRCLTTGFEKLEETPEEQGCCDVLRF
jgi:hypothetical protein